MKNFLIVLSLLHLVSCSYVSKVGIKRPKVSNKQFKLAWSKNLEPDYRTGNLPIALNYPLVHRGIVYISQGNGHMSAYDLSNGRPIWSKDDGSSCHGAPVVYKDYIVYGTVQGRIYARHQVSGKIKYSVDVGSPIESEGTLYKGRVFFHLRNHKIFSLDVETGKILWAYKRSVPFLTTLQGVSIAKIYKGKLFVGFADGFVCALSVEDGRPLWERKLASASKFIDADLTPTFYDNKLFIGSKVEPIYILSPKTGNVISRLSHIVSLEPMFFKNRIIFGTTSGEIILTDTKYKTRMKKKISTSAISSIIEWKKKFAISTVTGEIFLVNPVNFTVEETFRFGADSSSLFGKLLVSGDNLIAYSSRNRLYVFK
ncbi:MAG: PQQ-like beta-propeller repeat protein [Bacteriovoracaceae bacterium]|nr:PQQ-like beta-propeller repeat protein [Bacteriovoracaceae bacterium]